MSDLALASEFPRPTADAWSALVERVLKGAEFEKTLVSRTYDGLRIEPLYPRAEPSTPVRRAEPGPWRVAQRMDHPDPKEANALVLADLEGGADALVLSFEGALPARGFGVRVEEAGALEAALAGVMLDLVTLSVETAPFAGRAAADLIIAHARRHGLEPGTLTIDFGLDPVGDIARTGNPPLPWPDLGKRFAETASDVLAAGFGGGVARVDTRPYHEAGASEAQELAAALATGVTYLRLLEEAGHPLDRARDCLTFLTVADADEFLTIAKVRALRRLWARVEDACGLASKPIRLHAETAWRMATRRDPWVNLLRGTMAAFSAGIGGADSITVLPFTSALGLPDAFARRLARNTQTILLEEANVWRVQDPVAGSGAFEALTDALAGEAWARFQEIEREGGIVASLMAGTLQGRIAETRSKREAALATRRDPITGTSEFPDMDEAPVSVLLSSPRISGEKSSQAELGPDKGRPPSPGDAAAPLDLSPQAGRGGALPSIRAAQPYERLRDRADAIAAQTGRRPAVFLANLGPIAAFSARATFAKNAFGAGGIETVSNDGFSSLDELAAAFAQSGARIACICSSDEIYGTQAAPAAETLKAAGAAAIYLAGRPGEMEMSLREAGVDDFVFVGCDLIATLASAHHTLAAT